MTLDEMTTLVAKAEAMYIINNSLKSEEPKVTQVKGPKAKEDAMQALKVKPLKKKKTEKRPRRKLSDEAHKMGCLICGGDHRRDVCDADKSCMLCEICGKEKNHMTAVCLQQFADSTPAGQPGGRLATPGLQSRLVAMEQRRTKIRSYAQVAAGGALGSTDTPSVSPLPQPTSCPGWQWAFSKTLPWRRPVEFSLLLVATLRGQ